MSQYMPQMPQQMPMQGYPMQGMPQMPMQQPYPGPDIQGFITQMEQKVEEFKRRYQPPMQQPMMQQQAMQQPVQQDSRIVLIPVSSYQEVEEYDVDLTGKTQWFVIEDTEEVYTKRFDIKAKRPSVISKSAKLLPLSDSDAPQDAEQVAQAPESKPDPQPKEDEIDALRAQIAALNDKYKELEGKVNAKSDVVRPDERAKPNADVAKHDESPATPTAAAVPDGKPDAADSVNAGRGTKPKPDNRKKDTGKPADNADKSRPDS